MDTDAGDMAVDAIESHFSGVSSAPTALRITQHPRQDTSQSNATVGGVVDAVEPEIDMQFVKAPAHTTLPPPLAPAAASIEPVFANTHFPNDAAAMADLSLSDTAFAVSMASFTSDLQAELAQLATGPVASLYFSEHDTAIEKNNNATEHLVQPTHCTSCSASLETAFPDVYAATTATFCLCCQRPMLMPTIDSVHEEDAAFLRCAPCMLARVPTKLVVEEPWWPIQYKHALLQAVETKLWRKLIDVGNLPQSGESARHQLYHRRYQVENAQRVLARKTLDAMRTSRPITNETLVPLFREWRDLQVCQDAENFRIIVLLSKCLQEFGRGVPAEVGEALQLCRGRDVRSEHDTAKLAVGLLPSIQCGCCPAVLSIPPPSGVPLPNPCFCFCCARMVPESLMYQSENASPPTSGDLCLDCAVAHDDLERKWFLVSASPTVADWKRHKVAMGLTRQLQRVRNSAAAAYKSGCEGDKDTARWRVADNAATQWLSRTENIMSDQRSVLRRGWTPVADSRQCYCVQTEFEKTFVVAIPPLLKVLANLLVRQRIAAEGDAVRTAPKRPDSKSEARSEERKFKYRKL